MFSDSSFLRCWSSLVIWAFVLGSIQVILRFSLYLVLGFGWFLIISLPSSAFF
jgi:hypothetical protein